MDLIYRQTAIDRIEAIRPENPKKSDYTHGINVGMAMALVAIKEQPSAQPSAVRTGKWIERESGTEDKENGFETVIVCSCCDFPATTFYSEDCESRTQIRTDFCPNCGADMRGEKANENISQ